MAIVVPDFNDFNYFHLLLYVNGVLQQTRFFIVVPTGDDFGATCPMEAVFEPLALEVGDVVTFKIDDVSAGGGDTLTPGSRTFEGLGVMDRFTDTGLVGGDI